MSNKKVYCRFCGQDRNESEFSQAALDHQKLGIHTPKCRLCVKARVRIVGGKGDTDIMYIGN